MERDVALMIANTAARAAMDVGNLAVLLKAHGGDADEPVRGAIASATYEIAEIAEAVYRLHPELKSDAEARLAAFGRSYY